MTRFYNKFLAAASAMMLTLTGCVNEDSPCPGDGDDGTKVTLQFTVMTYNPAASREAQQSRADGDTTEGSLLSRAGDDCYDDLQGSPAENYINTADCQFLLFDADRKLLRPIFPEITGKDDVQYTYYTIKASITEPYFDEAVKADRDQIDFYIMVIANSHSTGLDGQYPGFTPGVTTIDDIAAQKLTFNLPERRGQYNLITEWQPNINQNKLIPMAGLQKFTVSATQLKESTYDVPVYLSDENANGKTIDMLRTMAKIEVIDKIDLPDGYDPNIKRMKVEKVELVGMYLKGTLMPSIGTDGQWPDYISTQITDATLPPNSEYTNPVAYSESYAHDNDSKDIMFFNQGSIDSENAEEKYPIFFGYVTEYSKDAIGNMVKPYLVITLIDESSPDNSDGQEISFFKELKLTGYVDGAPQGDGIDFLLRNHIYRYEINAVSSSEANIIDVGYTLCDWDRHEVNIPTFD